jgi:hypothetical protein
MSVVFPQRVAQFFGSDFESPQLHRRKPLHGHVLFGVILRIGIDCTREMIKPYPPLSPPGAEIGIVTPQAAGRTMKRLSHGGLKLHFHGQGKSL